MGRVVVRTIAAFGALLVTVCALAPATWAQDPTARSRRPAVAPPSFPKTADGIFGAPPKLDKTLPLYLQGDELVYDTRGNKVIARGNVEIYYNNNILTADEVVYDQGANTLSAVGNVVLKEANGNIIRADRYTLTDDFRDGFVQSLSVVSRDDSRLTAERATRREGNITEFTDAKFTPCKSKDGMPPLWCIGAKKVIHDQSAATITYQDAQFEIFGAPVFYLPYFQHADPSVKRKSGFLTPEYGSADELGFTLEVPYYLALSPNYDVTLHPMYSSQQGILYQADWRHRIAGGQYSVKLAGIDQDGDELPAGTDNRDSLDGWRGSVETKGDFSLASWWRFGWDVTLESDDTFRRFYKLDNILLTERVNNVYMKGISDRNYFAANFYHFGGLSFEDTPQSESLVHPIVDHNYVFSDPVLGGELRWDSNFMSFSRSDIDNRNKDGEITRAVTELKWRRRLTDGLGITYTPFAELRGDVYQFGDAVDPTSCTGVAPLITCTRIEDETVTRGLVTGGATVAYPWIATSGAGSHVIEPIGQVVTRQASVEQRTLPDEDAKSLIFDDTNLFETKFSGYDRIETGTRINAGVQYTFQSNTGGYVRVLAGQSFHVSGDNAYANPGLDPDGNFVHSPSSGLETDTSDYVVGFYVAPLTGFRFLSQSRFDDEDLDLRREDIGARFDYGPATSQVTYTYQAADPVLGRETSESEIIASLGVRLTDRWSVHGSIRFDIDEEDTLTDSIQLRYGDECFALSATYAETLIDDPARDLEPDHSVMLRFELKNLGSYNYKTDVLDHTFGDQQPPQP